MNRHLALTISLAIALAFVGTAYAYTTTSYSNSVCSGSALGSITNQSTNSCVSFCVGYTATCCTTETYINFISGVTTYSCTAASGTGITAKSPVTTKVGGEVTTRKSWTATIIDYSGTPVIADIVANPTTITTGQTSLLTWSSTGADTCTGTNFSTGGATSGSVSVQPGVNTLYTVMCENATASSSDSVWVYSEVFSVTCSVDTGTGAGFGIVGTPVTWTATPQYGPGAYSYSWSGTDELTGTASSVQKTYTAAGQKEATVTVTSGGYTIATECPYTACTASTCQSDGIIVTSSDWGTPDLTAGATSIASGDLLPGSTLTFSALLQNIGLGSVDSYFQNRFQVDVQSSGSYVYLDLLGTTESYTKYYGNKMCSGGTVVDSGSDVQDTGHLDNPDGLARAFCGPVSSGQCCQTNWHQQDNCSPPTICYYYFDWTKSDGASLVDEVSPSDQCSSEYNCQAGVQETETGIHYILAAGEQIALTSPTWDNVPPGTHRVRMCADLPSESFTEGDENNNCGAWYEFSIGGPDFTASTPNVNSGTLTSGQSVTFYSTLSNVGSLGHTGAIPNRFQIDLSNNGSWNTNLDVSVTDLAAGQTKEPVTPAWIAEQGMHAIRMCADTPASIAEENENNNCGTSLVFTVSAPTQCQDGLDNNGNGLIDLADTYACTSGADTTEEVLPAGSLTLILASGSGLTGKDIIRVKTPAILDWTGSNIEDDSCILTGTNGDSFALPGSSGTQATSPLVSETRFTLTCTDQNEDIVSTSRNILVSPAFDVF